MFQALCSMYEQRNLTDLQSSPQSMTSLNSSESYACREKQFNTKDFAASTWRANMDSINIDYLKMLRDLTTSFKMLWDLRTISCLLSILIFQNAFGMRQQQHSYLNVLTTARWLLPAPIAHSFFPPFGGHLYNLVRRSLL